MTSLSEENNRGKGQLPVRAAVAASPMAGRVRNL